MPMMYHPEMLTSAHYAAQERPYKRTTRPEVIELADSDEDTSKPSTKASDEKDTSKPTTKASDQFKVVSPTISPELSEQDMIENLKKLGYKIEKSSELSNKKADIPVKPASCPPPSPELDLSDIESQVMSLPVDNRADCLPTPSSDSSLEQTNDQDNHFEEEFERPASPAEVPPVPVPAPQRDPRKNNRPPPSNIYSFLQHANSSSPQKHWQPDSQKSCTTSSSTTSPRKKVAESLFSQLYESPLKDIYNGSPSKTRITLSDYKQRRHSETASNVSSDNGHGGVKRSLPTKPGAPRRNVSIDSNHSADLQKVYLLKKHRSIF